MSLKGTFIKFDSGNVEFYDGRFEHWFAGKHAVQRCDATTGHSVRDVAFCDTPERAVGFVTAIADRSALVEASKAVVRFCDDPGGSENPESLAMGLARLLPALRDAIAKAEASRERF